MENVIIDGGFREMLPALDEETYRLLEENLIQHGCLSPLVVWQGVLVDGHNRYEICKKHDIPFATVEKEFGSREEALIWIISNQVARRNLSPMQLSYFRGLHYTAEKKIKTNAGGKNQHSEVGGQKDHQPKTVNRLAKQYNVSPKTIWRDSKVAAALDAIGAASPSAKTKVLSGEANFGKTKLGGLPAMSVKDVSEVAAAIENGDYERGKAGARTQTKAETPEEHILSGMRILGAVIKNGDREELKAAIRTHIHMLEDMYNQL